MNQNASAPRRRRTLLLMLLGLLLIAGAAALWQWRVGQWYETTDNAYLTGNMVIVSAQIGGTVVSIGAEENDTVTHGMELVRLNDEDALQELQLRKEELALAVREIQAFRAQVQQAGSELALREVTATLAREEFERRKLLQQRKMVSEEELDAARTRAEETSGALRSASHALQEARVRAGAGEIAGHPLVLAGASRLRMSWRNWQKSRIAAPVSGEVARRKVQIGQRIESGSALFSIAQRDLAWVEANFKETQLRHMRPGQPVEMQSDFYGPDLLLHGRIESIGTGTGSVFSLLPVQNATGNWIKIVQRVPVRITLEQRPDPQHPLPYGASLHVRVDTRDRSATRVFAHARDTPLAQTDVFDYPDTELERVIADIIATNVEQGSVR